MPKAARVPVWTPDFFAKMTDSAVLPATVWESSAMSNPLRYRMAIGVLALIAGLVALYLHLWKLGLAGTLTCTSGHGCEVAMTSSWSWFLGVDVALIGAIGYGLILGVALWGAHPDRAWSTLPSAAAARAHRAGGAVHGPAQVRRMVRAEDVLSVVLGECGDDRGDAGAGLAGSAEGGGAAGRRGSGAVVGDVIPSAARDLSWPSSKLAGTDPSLRSG